MKKAPVCSLILACALMILASGCSGTKYPSYYALSLAPERKLAEGSNSHSVTIAVQRFATSTYIRQGRIVFRESPEKVGFYEYHRWATDPGVSVTAALIEGLRSKDRISVDGPAYSKDQSDYVLRGRVERLDEIDFDGEVGVEATLFAELTNGRTGEAIWSGKLTCRQPVDHRNVGDVVKKMNSALQTNVDQLLEVLDKNIAPNAQAKR